MFVIGIGFAESKRLVGFGDSLTALIICSQSFSWYEHRPLVKEIKNSPSGYRYSLCPCGARYVFMQHVIWTHWKVCIRSPFELLALISFTSQANATTNPCSKLFDYCAQLRSFWGMGSGDGIWSRHESLFAASIILAEPYSGILLLMIIKAYQTCEYMLFVTCTAQSLTKARACLVRHGPVFGLARLVYVDGMHIFHPKNPGLTISSGILYYIALFGTFKAPRQKFGLLISWQLSRPST